MQIKESVNVSFHGALKSPALEDVIVLADSAGVAIGAPRAFSPRVRSVPHDVSGPIASRWVEIPLVGSDGEISGILYRTAPASNTGGALSSRRPEEVRVVEDVAQFVVHDINNLFAVIGSDLRLLEHESDAGGFVSGARLAAMAGTLDQALGPDITVCTEIAPDLWDFNADPEELYFALLNLCRNALDAMPNGGRITVASQNVEPSAADHGFVEIVVADNGQGMTEEVLSQVFTPYFMTKAAGRGTGLGLAQVRHFAEGRGGVIGIESEPGVGTRLRLFIPRLGDAAVRSSLGSAEIIYTPSADGGVFQVVDPATAAAAS